VFEIGLPRAVGVALLAALVALSLEAGASTRKLEHIRAGTRVGPIVLTETTLRRAQSWFGDPTGRRRMGLGCIRAIRVRWGDRLEVFFSTRGRKRAIEGTVGKRVITSRKHGSLEVHTRKGLKVGDSNSRLRRLYPRKRPFEHGRHYDWFLASGPADGRLVAITKRKRGPVVALFAGPYENC
jgi:hypothetical protein